MRSIAEKESHSHFGNSTGRQQGNDIAYERGAVKQARALGVDVKRFLFDETVSIEDLRRTLEAINADPGIHGRLIFRPLPPHLDEIRLSGILRPEKDADVITAATMGQMVTRTGNDFAPCTAAACLELLAILPDSPEREEGDGYWKGDQCRPVYCTAFAE